MSEWECEWDFNLPFGVNSTRPLRKSTQLGNVIHLSMVNDVAEYELNVGGCSMLNSTRTMGRKRSGCDSIPTICSS